LPDLILDNLKDLVEQTRACKTKFTQPQNETKLNLKSTPISKKNRTRENKEKTPTKKKQHG
jgi:hypothetical protein